ncbi:MAG TPA: undecaprenyl-diphosphate phosphatase [Chthoniobacteraceae bacterium]
MPDWLIAIILGFVEGLTEFIPVSSTGHLLIVEHWLGLKADSFFTSDLFNVGVQCGAVVAVLPLFKDRLLMLTRWREAESRLFLAKIAAAFLITAVFGLIMDKAGYELTKNVANVAWALIIGGILFILAEKWLAARQQRSAVTWPSTFATGFGQVAAVVFPGLSRSGSTIIFALLCGTNRVAATEFSFLVGIPSLLAAGALKAFKALRHPEENAVAPDWAMLALASLVAAIVSFIAVKWLLRFVQSHTFIGFGVYRIILGILLLLLLRN